MTSKIILRPRFHKIIFSRLSEASKNLRSSYIYPTATTGTLMTLSDIIAQTICEKQENIDWVRTLRFAAFGYLIAGPINSVRYPLIEFLVKDKTKFGAVKKMLIDQTFVPPIFNFLFFTLMGVSKDYSWKELEQSYKTTCVEVTINSYKVFPVATTLAFLVIPAHHRASTLATVALVWNTYLSTVSAKRERLRIQSKEDEDSN